MLGFSIGVVVRGGVLAEFAGLLELLAALAVEHGNQQLGEGRLVLFFRFFALEGGFGFQIEQDAEESNLAFQKPLHEGGGDGGPLTFDGLKQFPGEQAVFERGARGLAGRAGGFAVVVFVVHAVAPEIGVGKRVGKMKTDATTGVRFAVSISGYQPEA